MSEYTTTVGIEVHAELKTRTKMFCDSANDPHAAEANTHICPICMAFPGTLPVINKEAVRHVLRVGTAINGTLADYTEFDRKNYFYPDLPKGYQISQFKHPLVSGGALSGVAVTRIHLEEDTARSQHTSGEYSLIDFNRAGVPLMELVTEPVIHDAKTAVRFAQELQLLLRTLGASDANMEKGEMRVEANISVAPINADSQRADSRGLLYEDLTYKIRGAAFAVYNSLGTGHKESVYQNAFAVELEKAGVPFEKEKRIDVAHGGKSVGSYQPDFVIDEKIIVELKALPFTGGREQQQVRYYLKNSSYRLSLLINFGSDPIGIERVVFDSIRDNPPAHQQKSAALGTKVEVKNLNSFKAVEKAIEFETKRHIELLENGGKVVQETRGWDEDKGRTFSQRVKEDSHDYRYFPDPDLPKLKLSLIPEFTKEEITATLPELPWDKRERYQALGIKEEDAATLASDPIQSEFFDVEIVGKLDGVSAVKTASNYLLSDVRGSGVPDALDRLRNGVFAELIMLVEGKSVSSRGAKDILSEIFKKGGSPKAIAEEKGLLQVHDTDALCAYAKQVVAENPQVANDFREGKEAALQFLVGQGMKLSRGSANPRELAMLIKKEIGV